MLTEFLLNGFQQASSAQGVGSRHSTSTAKNDTSGTTQPTTLGAATNAATVSISSDSLEKSRASNASGTSKGTNGKTLTEGQQKEVDELKKRDIDVHAHEQAHLAAAGPYAKGGAHYDYQAGPDGKRYAVGGEVNIDTSKEKDPSATLQKANAIRAAALAPADPSGQDQSVAAAATQMASEAQQELSKQSTANSSIPKEARSQNDSTNSQQGGVALNAVKLPSAYATGTRVNASSSGYSWVA